MGLWSFVKGAGKSVFNKKDKEPNVDDLLAEIEGLGLEAEGLDIEVDGDKVKVKGTPKSQEMKEKVILAVGNVNGIASVEDDVEGDEPVFHEVQKGDTLWAISSKTLGNGSRYNEIFEANKPMLSHPDKIYPGQMLRIPQDKPKGTVA
ncbi:peptidoglycan-binding protein LysM [Celeribacter arenosi]|uniref:Peptidoglycan-binding protein LysM n=1 Tax=Celeribacter arenosi TaxID=792649 RepID=A0ABP7K6P5_9RHOB